MGVTRIQHNLSAMNAMSNYQGNSGRLTNNLEKLSSGYRINSAADDAAGLAISEKMRSQIAGLEKAQDNANDGISLIQTAEGALTEVNSMLTRLKTLATQSANGTYEDGVDRANLQEETDALLEEIDRISQSTNFNGINLLDGSLSGSGSSNRTGGSEAVVISDIASLKTNQSVGTATSGKYSIDTAGVVTSGGDFNAGDSIKFSVTYVDAGGNEKTAELYTASIAANPTDTDVTDAIKDAINGNDELKKLFTATKNANTGALELEAKTAGTNGEQLLSLNVIKAGQFEDNNDQTEFKVNDSSTGAIKTDSFNAKVEKAAQDAEYADIIDFGTTPPTAGGETITVGNKTYEFVAQGGDSSKVAKGNIAVNIGTTNTMENFANALKANGVTSASVVSGQNQIKIGDMDQIKASNPMADITTTNTSKGIVISQAKPEKAVSQFTVGAGSGQKASFEIEYVNEEGETKKVSLSYTSSAIVADNRTAIKNAIDANDELKSLFATANAATSDLSLTAVHAGSSGAYVKSISTTDVDSESVGKLQQTTLGRDAGQSLSFDVDNITSGDKLTINGKTFEFVTSDKLDTVSKGNVAVLFDKSSDNGTVALAQNLNLAFKQNGINTDYNTATNSFYIANGTTGKATGGLVLQVGDTNDDFQKVSVQIDDMSSKGLGLTGLDISDQTKAGEAVDTIAAAVNKVSMQRGKLGALQNRLDHTLNNLDATTQNITAAESQIRDVDMAKEMTQYSKNNILVQAAQSMLAQANSLPQGVLSLLQ